MKGTLHLSHVCKLLCDPKAKTNLVLDPQTNIGVFGELDPPSPETANLEGPGCLKQKHRPMPIGNRKESIYHPLSPFA